MLYPTTITDKWQMTIPDAARKLLGLNETGKVFIEVKVKENSFQIKKSPTIFQLAGTFKPTKKISALKTREILEKHYERV